MSDLRDGGAGWDGGSRHRSGVAGALIFLVGGLIVAMQALTVPGRAPVVMWSVFAIGMLATAVGVGYLFVPWHRLPQRAQLVIVLPALVFVGVGNWLDPNPYLAVVFFFLLAMWVGMAQPRGTMLVMSPLFALAYWWPIDIVPHYAGLAESVPYVLLPCVLAGETLAWLMTQLHATQRRLREHDERRFQEGLERELAQQAFQDRLTGLPNRALLRERIRTAVEAAGLHGHTVALLLIDLDRFKEVNDTLGHRYGDKLLQQIARRFEVAVRGSDTVARLGGDEFAILLPVVTSIEDAVAGVDRLRRTIEAEFSVDGLTIDVDASIGLAVYPDHAGDPDELLQHAEIAMYAAKSAHLEYAVYRSDLNRHTPRRLSLLGQMRRALTNHEFVVYYQPKADSRSRLVIGAEALVRWQHPEYGMVAPDEFIGLAETTGLIRPLTSYVLEAALRERQQWLAGGRDLSVAVNVSARCLLDLKFPLEVAEMLADSGVPAERLVLEITESAIMNDPARALAVLNQLHAMNVQLSIDDFGTGYSSMAYLKDLPVDELKVDRSFVTQMRAEHKGHTIVRSTIDLAHNLGLKVVAEGVEDEETWAALDRLGCDTIQGYYLGRPMTAFDLVAWLDARAQPAARRRPDRSAAAGIRA